MAGIRIRKELTVVLTLHHRGITRSLDDIVVVVVERAFDGEICEHLVENEFA